MREYKYYATNICGYVSEDFRNKYLKHHNQWRIVCKAKSMAEANRIAISLGLPKFIPKYTSTTAYEIELKMCDKYGVIICTSGTSGHNYIDIKEAL
jgi:hypothetical protein